MPYGFAKADKEEEREDGPQGQSYDNMLSAGQAGAGAATNYAQSLGPPQQQAQAGAPATTASGYLNFGDFYGANEGVAKREAGKVNQKVSGTAQASQNALAAQAGQTSQAVQAGTMKGPTQGQRTASTINTHDQGLRDSAQTNLDSEDYAGPPEPIDTADPDTGRPLVGGVQTAAQPGGAREGGREFVDVNSPDFWAQQAAGGYTGPEELLGYDALLQGATKADEQLAALNSGDAGVKALAGNQATDADAALLGAAGRNDFAKTNQTFGKGDFLKGGLRGQVGLTQKEIEGARGASKTAAGDYAGMLDDYSAAQENSEFGTGVDTQTIGAAPVYKSDQLNKFGQWNSNYSPYLKGKDGNTAGTSTAKELAKIGGITPADGEAFWNSLTEEQVQSIFEAGPSFVGPGAGTQEDVNAGMQEMFMALYENWKKTQKSQGKK